MTHAANLIRFTLVSGAIAFAFAFNLAAMYAQIVYVFLPGTRVTGAPPLNWLRGPEAEHIAPSALVYSIVTNPPLFMALLIAAVVVCAIVVWRSPK